MPHRCDDASFRHGNISKGIDIRRLRILQPFGIPSSSAGICKVPSNGGLTLIWTLCT